MRITLRFSVLSRPVTRTSNHVPSPAMTCCALLRHPRRLRACPKQADGEPLRASVPQSAPVPAAGDVRSGHSQRAPSISAPRATWTLSAGRTHGHAATPRRDCLDPTVSPWAGRAQGSRSEPCTVSSLCRGPSARSCCSRFCGRPCQASAPTTAIACARTRLRRCLVPASVPRRALGSSGQACPRLGPVPAAKAKANRAELGGRGTVRGI